MRRRGVLAALVIGVLAAALGWCGSGPEAPGDPPTEAATTTSDPDAPRSEPVRGRSRRAAVADEGGPPEAAAEDEPPADAERPKTFDLVVTVKDAAGEPAAGVDVLVAGHDLYLEGYFAPDTKAPRAPKGSGRTDAKGQARLTDLPLADSWGLRAIAARGTQSGVSSTAYIKDAGPHALTVQLAEGIPVRGRVVDTLRRVIPRVQVDLVLPEPTSSAFSSNGPYGTWIAPRAIADGAFEFGPLPVQERASGFTLRVRAEGYLSGDTRVANDAARAGGIEVVLQRPITVTGRLVDAAGEGVPDGIVTVVPSGRLFGRQRVPADADGRFAVHDVPESGGFVAIMGPTSKVRHVPLPATADDEVDLGDLRLEPGAVVSGIVVDRFDAPLAGVIVQAMRADRRGDARRATTDAAGRFEVATLGDVPHRLWAGEEGAHNWAPRSAAVSPVEPGASDVRIVLTGGRLLAVHVSFRTGDEPGSDPPYTHLVVQSATGDPNAGRLPDVWDRGRYRHRFAFKAAGSYDVTVEMAGYVTATRRVEVRADRETRVDITLRKAAAAKD